MVVLTIQIIRSEVIVMFFLMIPHKTISFWVLKYFLNYFPEARVAVFFSCTIRSSINSAIKVYNILE